MTPHRRGVDRVEPVTQELRVEADLERIRRIRRRQALAGLADVLGACRNRQLALGEAQPKRRVALREQADAPHDVEELLARELELVLELLGQELAIVRELPVDPARGQPDVAGAEDDVVLLQCELDLVGRAGDPLQLLERSSRDDRLERGERRPGPPSP